MVRRLQHDVPLDSIPMSKYLCGLSASLLSEFWGSRLLALQACPSAFHQMKPSILAPGPCEFLAFSRGIGCHAVSLALQVVQ